MIETEVTKQDLLAERVHNIFYVFSREGIDARLVGSIARSVVFNQVPSLASIGGESDIDVLLMGEAGENIPETLLGEVERATLPFRLDRHGKGKITEHDGQTFINYKGISLPVDPNVFNLRKGKLEDDTIPTFDPNTLYHLTTVYGPIRPKDWKSLLGFARQMRQSQDHLPDELFEPFHELADQRRQQYPLDTFIGNARWEYHKRVPYEARVVLSKAFVGTARNIVSRMFGWIEPPHI